MASSCIVFYGCFRIVKYAFTLNILLIGILVFYVSKELGWALASLYYGCPLLLIVTAFYVFVYRPNESTPPGNDKFKVSFATSKGRFKLDNIKRGASVIGSAGSGKTESVVYGFLKHFHNNQFCGIIHDYKDFELTEMAYPLFKDGDIPLKVISFDRIIYRVNPIAPRYLENEESVNEVSRVLIENLLEQRESSAAGTTKFFNDAAEAW